MPDKYEFSYQSPKQKILLASLKFVVLIALANSFYMLGWIDESFDEKLSSVGGICIGFWIYSNLLRVKSEVSELFVPPFKIFFAVEFMLFGFFISIYNTLQDIVIILKLHQFI